MDRIIDLPCYLIEDDKPRAKSISEKLHHNGGFINVTTFVDESYSDAIDLAVKCDKGVLICDYKLDHIGDGMRGASILKAVRNRNSSIVLVLYTAFKAYIPAEMISWLVDHNVHIYEKGDDIRLALNLRKQMDEANTRESVYETEKKNKISDIVKQQALNQLMDIRDKSTAVTISNGAVYSVEEVIKEVKKESLSGLAYLEDWIRTNLFLGRIRKDSKNEN